MGASEVIGVIHHQGEHLLLISMSEQAKHGRRVVCFVVTTDFGRMGGTGSVEVGVEAEVISAVARSNLDHRVRGGVQLGEFRCSDFFIHRVSFSGNGFQWLSGGVRSTFFREGIVMIVRIIGPGSDDHIIDGHLTG